MPAGQPPFDVLEAFREIVKGYGDVEKLAALLGTTPGVLYAKANPSDTHHKPTLADAVRIQVVAGDTRIVQAMAALLGGVFVPLRQSPDVCDAELLEIVTRWMGEQGQFFSEMHAALADGKVDPKEHAALRERAQFVIAAVFELWERLGQMNRRAP